jgi:hypothetical protein
VIVISHPRRDLAPGVIKAEEQALVEQLVAHPAVEAFDKAILHRLARRDEMPIHLHLPAPGEHRVAGELRAVVADDQARRAPSFDNGSQLARDATSRDRGVGDRAQALLGDVVEKVEDAEAPAVGELVLDEVDGPPCVRLGFDRCRSGSCWNAYAAPSVTKLSGQAANATG